ncbi:MAG: YegS/Rv2252/BmrU family lipid kinase [Clostridia bacterium]|nr:YegS/Rv2252/BmrU family lipid kinase [Clostridia bacterium]
MEKRKVLLIVNPRAGKMTFRNSFYSVVRKLSDAGCDVNVHFTTACGDATETVVQRGGDFDSIVCCSGDGTLNETITGMLRLGKQIPLGYIPCGSTNDFAATLGIVGTPSRICDDIISGNDVVIDAGQFNDRYFTYAASFGAFTAISYETPQGLKNALGHFAYVLNGAKELISIPRVKMKVITDDYEEEGTFFYGGVTNTTSIGGLYSLPEEEIFLDDGHFELLMIREPKHYQEYSETLLNLAVRNFDDPNILYLHAKEIRFESEEPVSFTLDGEFGGSGRSNTIKVLNKAIRVNGHL